MLSQKGSWEFKSLFDIVHAGLRSKDLARGGEEMLRLRAHEKLQSFLQSGIVTKTGREYTGVPKALEAFFKTAAEFNAKFAAGTHAHPPVGARVTVTAPLTTKTEEVEVAKVKLPVGKARAGLAKQAPKAPKAKAKAR